MELYLLPASIRAEQDFERRTLLVADEGGLCVMLLKFALLESR
jgi:hypothetical protein